MPLASIGDIALPSETTQIAHFADIASIIEPPSGGRASFADIVSVLPPVAPARMQSPADAERSTPGGLIEAGNVDLSKQPRVRNADGSTSTVDSVSVDFDGRTYLLPTVTPDGRHFQGSLAEKADQANAEFKRSGRHLGIFDSPASASAYGEQLHNDYAAGKFANRPAPIAAEGVTDPTSVRVTDAPLAVPPPETPTTHGYFNPKTGTQVQTPAAGAGALEAPFVQTAAGVSGLVKAFVMPPQRPSGTGYFNPKTGTRADVGASIEPATLRAGNDLADGLMQLATPLIAAGALAQPLGTAAALVKAAVAATLGQHVAAAVGASPEAQSLVGNVAALLSGTVSGGAILEKIRADARSVAAQARAFDAAHPDLAPGRPQPPVEPRPVGAGSTPAAGGRILWSDIDHVVTEGAPGAVQEPSAAGVDVRQPSGHGEAVGRGDAEGQVPAGPRQELVAAPQTPAGGERVPPAVIAQTSAPSEPQARPPKFPKGYAKHYTDNLEPFKGVNGEWYFRDRRTADVYQVGPEFIELRRGTPGARPELIHDDAGIDGAVNPAAVIVRTATGERRDLQAPPPAGFGDELRQRASGATMEAADAGIRQKSETAVAPAGPLESGSVEERPPVAGGGPQPPGQRPLGGRPREPGPTAAAAGRAAEADTLDSLVSHAQTHGYAGDPVALRGELENRLALIKDLDREFADSGRNPDTLLRDIARLGGLSVKAETGLKGELKWLKEFQDNLRGTTLRPRAAFGQVRGVQGVFREGGLPVDTMLTRLQQDPRYAHLDSLDTLLEEIRAAAMADHEGTAVQRLREGLGESWWERLTPAAADRTDELADRFRQMASDFKERRTQFLEEHPEARFEEKDLFNDEPGSSGLPRRPFTGEWDRIRVPGEKPPPPVPPKKPAAGEPSLFDKEKASGMPVSPRPASASPGGMFGKQELPANRPTTLPARRFGRKVRVLPVAEMVQKLSDLFGRVPVSTGKLYKGYLGVYQHGPESIRVQVADDLHVIAHEMGHHLDMAVMEGSVVFNRGPIAKELKRLGAPTSMPSYTPAQQRREGTAEFFRRWLTDETDTPRSGPGVTLATEAPRFTAAFEQYLARHPKIGKGLREIRNDVQRYLALPAEEQARLHIDFEGGGRQILKEAAALWRAEQTPEGRQRTIAFLSSHWNDDLAYLRLAEEALADGRPVDITESAYVQARLARGSAAKAEGFLAHGVRDVDGTFLGRSLDDALSPVYDRLDDFALYAAARRAKTMHRRGKESGFTASQITATIEKYQSPAFDQALEGLREFHRAKLEYMVNSGAISGEQMARLLKVEPDYIPYQRIQDTISSYLTGKKLANRGSPVKRLKGSGRRIANPLETIIRNTHAEVRTVEDNKAMLKFVRLAVKTQGHGKWLEELPEPKVATTFNLKKLTEEIRTALEGEGVELPNAGLDLDEILDQLVTVFTPQQFARGNSNIVTVLEAGKRRWFEVHDPGLYDALTAIGPQGTEAIVRWFLRPARLLQRTAVSTLGFLVRNPIKDQFTATVQSRAGYRPVLDFARGLFHYLKHDELYQLYVNSLADQATMVSDDRNLLRKRLRDLGKGPLRKLLDHTILGPFDGLQALSHAGESATRIGEFQRTLDRAGEVTAASLTQGALNARDVSQDFQKAGRQQRAWNRYVAFFSARVGGYGRMWEAFHENPTGFAWKTLAMITLPSVLLWLVNHDDQEYNERPAWERNYFWHIPIVNPATGAKTGTFIRFPKPFELGQLAGTSIELALEQLFKADPNLADRLLDRRAALQLVQQIFPTAVLPLMEVSANYDLFRDRYIVSPWQEDLAPPLQYNRWTSEGSKLLGEFLDVSPAKLDTLIYGYTAGVGQGAANALDVLLGSKKPSAGPGRWPGVGAVYTPAATSEAQSLTDFYTARDLLAGLKASVKDYGEMGREDKARALVEKHRKLAPLEQSVPAADKKMKDLRKDINEVFASTRLTPAQKRAALDAIYLRMLNLARQGLGRPPMARKPPPESAFR